MEKLNSLVWSLFYFQIGFGVTNFPPTLDKFSEFTGGEEDKTYKIKYNQLLPYAHDTAGTVFQFKVTKIDQGTLTKVKKDQNSAQASKVLVGDLIGPGEEFLWNPPADVNGVQKAFALAAFGVSLRSVEDREVKINLLSKEDLFEDLPALAKGSLDSTFGENGVLGLPFVCDESSIYRHYGHNFPWIEGDKINPKFSNDYYPLIGSSSYDSKTKWSKTIKVTESGSLDPAYQRYIQYNFSSSDIPHAILNIVAEPWKGLMSFVSDSHFDSHGVGSSDNASNGIQNVIAQKVSFGSYSPFKFQEDASSDEYLLFTESMNSQGKIRVRKVDLRGNLNTKFGQNGIVDNLEGFFGTDTGSLYNNNTSVIAWANDYHVLSIQERRNDVYDPMIVYHILDRTTGVLKSSLKFYMSSYFDISVSSYSSCKMKAVRPTSFATPMFAMSCLFSSQIQTAYMSLGGNWRTEKTNYVLTNYLDSFYIDPQGNLLVAFTTNVTNPTTRAHFLSRMKFGGTFDASFGDAGTIRLPNSFGGKPLTINDMEVDSRGKVLIRLQTDRDANQKSCQPLLMRVQ